MQTLHAIPPFSGEVIHGKHLGRTIGFPTANVALSHECYDIADGTYGLSAIVDGERHYGIGVYLRDQDLFEAHLFDFHEEIYGQIISVTPLFLIRGNQKFSGLDALKLQIEKDRKVMLDWLSSQKKK
jgi:riboflavin kinase/FMN adenylyltransferase